MRRKFDPTVFFIPSLLIILIFTGVLMAGGPIIPTVFTVVIILTIFYAGSKTYKAHHEKTGENEIRLSSRSKRI